MSKDQSQKNSFLKGIASSWKLEVREKIRRVVSPGAEPAPAGPGMFWTATRKHLHSILQKWGGKQRKKHDQICISEQLSFWKPCGGQIEVGVENPETGKSIKQPPQFSK